VTDAPQTAEAMAERLARWIAAQPDAPPGPVAVRALRRLAGGASRESWAFELESGGESRPLVLRRDPPGRVGEGDRSLEFRAVRTRPVRAWTCWARPST